MIRTLRNRHRKVWLSWAVILPLLFILAIVFVPRFSTQKLISKNLPEPLPILIHEYDNDICKVNIRSDKQGKFQLEMFVKKAIKLPAPVVYVSYGDYADDQMNFLLGNGGRKGLYRWPIPKDGAKSIFFKSTLGSYPIIPIDF